MVTQEETLNPTPETEETERWLGPIKVHGGSDTVIRKAKPRSNLERFKAGSSLAEQLREASTLQGASLRHREYDRLVPTVLPMFEELLGESMLKVEKEELVHADVAGGQPLVRSSI